MASDNIRATLRNLYINAVVSLMILGYFFLSDLLVLTTLTQNMERILFWAAIAALVAWILFLGHCCGELVLELRRSNYHYLWSFLPFFLPVIAYAGHAAILGLLPALQ